jgi:hypothetical protein
MCVDLPFAPEVAFTQTDQYTAPPAGKWQKEWHGTFTSTGKSPNADFVAVMRVGSDCGKATSAPSVTPAGNGVTVSVDGKTLTFAGDAVTVK